MQYRQTTAVMLLSLTTLNAHAALSASDGGLGVYDSATNIIWTSDANLLGTWEAANPNIISTIIAAEQATISATYGRTLSNNDFGTKGLVDWWGAQAFVDYLNKIDYGNSDQWALPSTPDRDASFGYNKTSSQLGELFYHELGGTEGSPIPTNSLFTNVQLDGYWSGTEYSPNPIFSWFFNVDDGSQNGLGKTYTLYAWAVHPGPLSAVPEPGFAWMLLTGLVGWLGLMRRG